MTRITDDILLARPRRAVIRRQPLNRDESYPYPWEYVVEHDPPQDDALDYGTVGTFAEAVAIVAEVLAEAAREPLAAEVQQ